MKREGRQHGMVQTYSTGAHERQKFTSPATAAAGNYAKVSRKPTNHSKFTGGCGRVQCNYCRGRPAGKSKDKVKGTHRFRSCDVVTNYRLVTWRVVDPRPGLKFNGFSASGILDHLDNDRDDDSDEYDGYGDENDECGFGVDPNAPVGSTGVEIEELDEVDDVIIGGEDVMMSEELDEVDGVIIGGDDVMMSFCDVGFVWEQVEADGDVDGWCLVDEI